MEKIQQVLVNLGADPAALQPLYIIDGDSVYHVITTGEEVLDVWMALRSSAAQMGHWPVILGSATTLYEELQEIAEEELAPRQIIDRAAEVDPVKWLKDRVAEDPDYYEFRYGEWPTSGAAIGKYMIYREAETEALLSDVSIALIPTSHHWETPGFLGFGGWSDCPFAEEHVAMLKRWGQLYGAEVVGISRSRLEMRVLSPPRDQQKAMELAQEQFIYCPDLVHQGTQTLNSLAANLCNNTIWNFWWN